MQASIGNVNAEEVPRRALDAARWRTAFWIAWTVVSLVRIVLAAKLAPFGDEAWYWQESRHPALGYSDLPPATAWLIALGGLLGDGTLPMRAPFLLLGALLPLLMVSIGRRLFDPRAGWCAGLLTLAMPLFGTLGIFALPDVPLTFCSALALDGFERAARTRRLRDWTLLGIALALAWLCHYRAAMLMLAGAVFLVLAPRGRALLRTPGVWVALAVSLLGLAPTLWFNATHAWIALGFQLVERNPWRFHADALVQPLEQALVCTPLFYGLLLYAAWQCLRRRAQAPYDLLAAAASVPIGVYFVAGCFADDTRFRVHWPMPGYLPLLLVVPVLLRELISTRARWLRGACVTTLALGSSVAFAYLTMAAIPGGAVALASVKAFPEHLVGWREAAQETQRLLAEPAHKQDVLVADNFMLAAELDFAFDGARNIYALDHPINAKHGRAPQLALWERDEAALARMPGRPLLLVAEPTARRERERAAWMQGLCARITDLKALAALDLYDGRKRYRWFNGMSGANASASTGCAGIAP